VRRTPASVSDNVRRKWPSIARWAVHHCAPLQLWIAGWSLSPDRSARRRDRSPPGMTQALPLPRNITKATSPIPNRQPPNPNRPCQCGPIRPSGASGRRTGRGPWGKDSALASVGAVDASGGLLADPAAWCTTTRCAAPSPRPMRSMTPVDRTGGADNLQRDALKSKTSSRRAGPLD
jgi:hypothetical protein